MLVCIPGKSPLFSEARRITCCFCARGQTQCLSLTSSSQSALVCSSNVIKGSYSTASELPGSLPKTPTQSEAQEPLQEVHPTISLHKGESETLWLYPTPAIDHISLCLLLWPYIGLRNSEQQSLMGWQCSSCHVFCFFPHQGLLPSFKNHFINECHSFCKSTLLTIHVHTSSNRLRWTLWRRLEGTETLIHCCGAE